MKPYVPEALPLDCLDVGRLIRRVGSANAAIARYDGLLQSVVNPSMMLSPLTQREAVLSSRIEGTQATVDEVLEYEAGIEFDPEKTNDIKEVVNYRKTLTLASESLADRPIFQTPDFIDRSQIPKPTAATVIKKLKNAGILATIREPSGSRPAILAFAELVNQAEGRRVL